MGISGNNTPSGILHTYAPSSENNTRAYIDDVTSRTGFGSGQRLDLHNPEVLKKLMASMIRHEQGSQPYTEEQLKNAIRTAITDDRWSGKRSPELLSAAEQYQLDADWWLSPGINTGAKEKQP